MRCPTGAGSALDAFGLRQATRPATTLDGSREAAASPQTCADVGVHGDWLGVGMSREQGPHRIPGRELPARMMLFSALLICEAALSLPRWPTQ
jgi:hypothetical protein